MFGSSSSMNGFDSGAERVHFDERKKLQNVLPIFVELGRVPALPERAVYSFLGLNLPGCGFCRACGKRFAFPVETWKTLRVSHSPHGSDDYRLVEKCPQDWGKPTPTPQSTPNRNPGVEQPLGANPVQSSGTRTNCSSAWAWARAGCPQCHSPPRRDSTVSCTRQTRQTPFGGHKPAPQCSHRGSETRLSRAP